MRSLLYKILLSSLLVILLPMTIAILWTSNTFTRLLERRFTEKSMAQAEQVKLLLAEKQDLATGLVSWIAEMPGVKAKLKENNREGLFQLLLPLVGSVELDFIEILDREGKIFLRVHSPFEFGDRPFMTKDIQGLLKGTRDLPNYGVERRAGMTYLRAAESIQEEGVLGVVSAGYAINEEFVGKLEKVAGGRVLIAAGNRRHAAHAAGDPAEARAGTGPPIGSRPFQWHRQGSTPSLEIRLPLKTARGTEGVVSVFFPSLEMTAAIGTLQITLLVVAVMGTVLAFSVSWLLSRRLTRPVKDLVRATEEVAAGNYAGAVRIESRDEIGALAASFTRMVEELRKSKAEVESYRRELEKKFTERGRELAETELKRAAMAHMIAHDLKNPLLGIKKALEGLDRTGPETSREQRRKILKDLLSAGDLVIGMVNEMLDLYRSDFGDLPLSLSSIEMEEWVQTTLRILGPELEEKRLQVLSRFEPSHISLVADKRRLTRLLINLVSNAIKFSPKHGRIYVSACLLDGNGGAGPRVLVRVEDEGTGIAEQDIPRIFDRFYSRDQGIAEAGTGLGLPYCRLVAEAHGGEIRAETRSEGGLAVSVFLPANDAMRRASYGA